MAPGTGLEHCLILPQSVHNLRLLLQQQLLPLHLCWATTAPPSLGNLGCCWMGEAGKGAEGLAGCRVGASTVQPFQSRLQAAGMQGCSRMLLLHSLTAPQVQLQERPAAPAQQLGQLNINGAAPEPGTFLPCIIGTLKSTAWGQGLWQLLPHQRLC